MRSVKVHTGCPRETRRKRRLVMSKKIKMVGEKFGRWTILDEAGNRGNIMRYVCRCECGTIKNIRGTDLRNGHSKSCGCRRPNKVKMIGQVFSRWTVLEEVGKNKHGQILWKCLCECGNLKVIDGGSLRNGGSKSCGCWKSEKASNTHRIDLTGKVFGRLTVLSEAGVNKHGSVIWRCKCECGHTSMVATCHLRGGYTSSCGCKSKGPFKDEKERNHSPLRAEYLLFSNIPSCDHPQIIDGAVFVCCKMCGKAFTPTYLQAQTRIQSYVGKRSGESNFYCSDGCRSACPIFGARPDLPDPRIAPQKFEKTKARSCQMRILKQNQCHEVGYNSCERCGDIIDVELHHTILVSENPYEAMNPAGHILLCAGCHTQLHAGCRQ